MYNPRDEQEALEHFKKKIGQIVGALLAHLAKRHPRKYGLLRHKTVPAKILVNNDYFEAVLPTITFPPLKKLVGELYNVVASSLDPYAPLPEIILSEGFGPSVTGVEPRRSPVMGITRDEMKALAQLRVKIPQKNKKEAAKKQTKEKKTESEETAAENAVAVQTYGQAKT